MRKDKKLLKRTLEIAMVVTSATFCLNYNSVQAIETTLGNESVYTLEETNLSDYDFKDYTINSDSLLETYYYNYLLKNSYQNGMRRTSGTDGANLKSNFVNKFSQSGSENYGGAIFLPEKEVIGNITGDFINNYVINSNAYSSSSYTYSDGGAIYSRNSQIADITGDFINNHAEASLASGGAIYADNGSKINNINGNFINNYNLSKFSGIPSGTATGGGAIYIGSTGTQIENINGNFIGNHANATTFASVGGAIQNWGSRINTIKANFYDNYTVSPKNAYGGAIYNDGSYINTISGKFINNSTRTTTSDSLSLGGAIFSNGDLTLVADGNINGAELTLFKDNYSLTNRSKINNAIFMSTRTSYGLHNTLTMNTINNGIIQFEDTIDGGYLAGDSGSVKITAKNVERNGYYYNINIIGDNSSKVILNNSVINANTNFNDTNLYMSETAFSDANTNLNVNSGTVHLANDINENYQINKLTSNSNANYTIDVDLKQETPVTDTITIGNGSSGTITISDINVAGELKDFNVKILNAKNDDIQLSLSELIQEKFNTEITDKIESTDTVTANVNWNDTFNKYEQTSTQTSSINLATTNTTNDSLNFQTVTSLGSKVISGTMGDTLALLNQLNTDEDRNFNFDTANDVYNVTADLGETTAGVLNINGVKNGEKLSTIDLQNHDGFTISDSTTNLSINNTNLTSTTKNTSVITVSANNANINLNNAYIDGSIISSNNYNINIEGDDLTTINGTLNNANTTLNKGTLKFIDNTFKDNSNTLNVNNGKIDLVDNEVTNYSINQLNSNAKSNYAIDINAKLQTTDTIIAGKNSSGTVTISDVNFINSAPTDTFKVQVLQANDDTIQLALGNYVTGNNYNIGTTTKTIYDNVNSTVNFKEIFNKYTQTGDIYGSLGLATTNTTNDSIELAITNTVWNEDSIIVSGTMGDTLALVNQLQTTEDRNFNFDTSKDVYNVTADLGETTAGTLNINGVAENGMRSEINLNGHSGFELTNNTTLNVNNTQITGNDNLIAISNPDTTVNLTNTNLNGNISSNENYTLNISGTNTDTTVINGIVGNANTKLIGSNLEFKSDTFKDASLNAQSGTINLQDGTTSNYNISSLTSNANTDYKFDVDLSGTNATADKLSVGNGSNGTVTVSSLNFINSANPNSEFTVQLLDTANDDIQLKLDSTVSDREHELGTVTKTTYDTIIPTVNWQDKFNSHTKEGKNYGNMSLATTNTTNDSVALTITNTKWQAGEKTVSMGDTLALVNQLQTTEDRNFNFDTSKDVYNVNADLGETTSGTININGITNEVQHSTINGNNHSLFKLDNATTLNLNNVKVIGAKSVATGTNKDAVITLNNVELKDNTNGIKTAGSVKITGNSVVENNGNGIEVTSADSVVTLNTGDITLRDKLTGVAGARLNIGKSTVNIEKKISVFDIMMENSTANLKSDDLLSGNNLTVQSASNLNMINNATSIMHLNTLSLKDNLNLAVDVDLANKSMDRITADNYDLGNNTINVNQMNMLSDSRNTTTEILFADENLRNNVITNVSEVAYSPIYKYAVDYSKDTGHFTFTRGGNSDNPNNPINYNNLNPAVMVSPVAAQLGGYMGMIDTYNNAFNNMDMRMLMPSNLRIAQKQANKYAITETSGATYTANETNHSGTWVRPFAAYDSVGLKNGPKVNNFSYGTFIGGDTGIHEFKNGYDGVLSAHVSYLGSHQSFNGNSIYQNGANLGLTGTLYKGNFFTGLSVNAGAGIADASTMYGNEDFPMLMAGIANKTGYNIEFKEGKFIIQPSLLLSYTFVNTFDYTNGAGVKIDGDPLHAFQISPNVRFALNSKNGWQPYLTFGMNWNIMNSSEFKANATELPNLSVKPYFQYGLGLQKTIKDNFTAFAQVMLRNGGRNGIAANIGMKFILGRKTKTKENI